MDRLEDFLSGKPEVRQKGELSEFQAFLPSFINREWYTEDPETNKLMGDAMLALGNLSTLAEHLPDVDIYIKMHIRTEANCSSRIEGTRTTLEEDLLPIEEIAPEKRDDYREVQNYVTAINYGIDQIMDPKGLPLCNRLLRNCHLHLMQGVRGENKTPGEFRRTQNWIGGHSINSASYVPPSEERVPELMDDFERFINAESKIVPPLMKAAILHYQFETIHPFLDGNGRIGRLMIPLFLLDQKILTKPCFYISSYLESHRSEYYSALQNARAENNLLGWYKFFLIAVMKTANSVVRKFQNVTNYVEELNQYLIESNRKNTKNIRDVIWVFYSNPTLDISQLREKTQLTSQTLNSILADLVRDGILEELTGFSRNRIYQMAKYINLFMD